MEANVNMGMSDSDDDSQAKVDVSWFDNFVDRKNISLDDQVEKPIYRQPSEEFRLES